MFLNSLLTGAKEIEMAARRANAPHLPVLLLFLFKMKNARFKNSGCRLLNHDV